MRPVIVVPYQELSAEALHGVIDHFVLREGTDYGHRDYTLDEKRGRVLVLLRDGKAEICYDPEEDHLDIRMTDT